MSKTENKTVVDLSTLDLDALRNKHKKIKKIVVKASDGSLHEFVIGKPTLAIMDMVTKYLKDDNYKKYREVYKNSCVLAGDTDLLDADDDIRSRVFKSITEMYEDLEVTEEKEL